ncbi:MAG: Fic family protein [Xanthomonadales bacterium]|nr:Fic family protein [Xanthomonadales bacterium]
MEQIHQLRNRYLKVVDGKESLLRMIGESEISEQVYNSNAIENSTLSLDETEKILLQIDLDRYINERELFEAKNLARVVEYINSKALEKRISIDLILLLHKMLISNIRDEIAGRFRAENEWVRVANYIAPNPKDILGLIQSMMVEYHVRDDLPMVKRIAKFHLTFEHIHPFVDGNGRIGRLLNNYLLIRDNYVPINIKFIDRSIYYQAFQEYDKKGSTKIMEKIVKHALCASYHKRLAYMEDKKIIKLSEYAKSSKYSHSNLLNKANRQTIEAFMEKGIWKIGSLR